MHQGSLSRFCFPYPVSADIGSSATGPVIGVAEPPSFISGQYPRANQYVAPDQIRQATSRYRLSANSLPGVVKFRYYVLLHPTQVQKSLNISLLIFIAWELNLRFRLFDQAAFIKIKKTVSITTSSSYSQQTKKDPMSPVLRFALGRFTQANLWAESAQLPTINTPAIENSDFALEWRSEQLHSMFRWHSLRHQALDSARTGDVSSSFQQLDFQRRALAFDWGRRRSGSSNIFSPVP